MLHIVQMHNEGPAFDKLQKAPVTLNASMTLLYL